MKDEDKGKDKRRYPRLNTKLPMEIGSQFMVIKTETKNISCSGAYCHIDSQIPVMSKVKVAMSIPSIKGYGITSKNIACEGVIVRAAGCNTAIMFTRISKRDKNSIAEYIKTRLALMAV